MYYDIIYFLYLFIYLAGPGLSCRMRDLRFSLWSLVVACKVLLVAVGSSSLTRDGTQASCIESMESQPLDHPGSPHHLLLSLSYGTNVGNSPGKDTIISWCWNLLIYFRGPFFFFFLVYSSTLTNILYSLCIISEKKSIHNIFKFDLFLGWWCVLQIFGSLTMFLTVTRNIFFF